MPPRCVGVGESPALIGTLSKCFSRLTSDLIHNCYGLALLLGQRTHSPRHDVTQHSFGHEWNSHNLKKKDENGARGWRRQINCNFLAAYQDARRLSIIIISTCCANAHLFELLGKPRALCEITAPSGVPSFGTHILTFEYIINIHFFARRKRMELESIRGILITS